MTLPIRTLPLEERWDCHGCGRCCRGTIIRLNDDDVARLRQQRWDEHPDYRGQKIVVRRGLLAPSYSLAKRRDGTCIFLDADNLCRIHRQLGLEAKPLVCQMFPLQLIPQEDFAYLTLRRYCPSVAADRGRDAESYLDDARRLAEQGGLAAGPGPLPSVARRQPRSWEHFHRAAGSIERMLRDERFPLVRRVVHGLVFCDHIESCRLQELSSQAIAELIQMLENSAVREAGEWFQSRRPPGRAGSLLFRQAALEYTRLHPQFTIQATWGQRWRLARTALAFMRGRGALPPMHECFRAKTFEQLERPTGPLDDAVLRPLVRFFEANAASRQYALLNRPGWTLVDSFRALALNHALALWLLRLCCGNRPPQADDMIDVVGTLDRSQGYALLAGGRSRRRIRSLARMRELARLVVWYSR